MSSYCISAVWQLEYNHVEYSEVPGHSNRPSCFSVRRYRRLSLHGPLKFTDFAISLGSASASWCFARLTTKLSLLNLLPPHRGPLPLTPKPSCSEFHETSQERGFLPSPFSLGPGKCIFPEARDWTKPTLLDLGEEETQWEQSKNSFQYVILPHTSS